MLACTTTCCAAPAALLPPGLLALGPSELRLHSALPGDDAGRILAARDGDEAAWRWLCGRYHGQVLRRCRFLGGGRIDASDAAQEVFIQLHGRFGRLADPDRFDAFLYGITRRVVSEQRRRAWLRRWAGELFPNAQDPQPGAELRLSLSERGRQVQELLDGLPARDRELLALRYMEELDAAQIALLLGENHNTLRKRLGQARERFRQAASRRGLAVEWS